MIIARYLSKQILTITSALCFVILMIIMLSRVLKYLAEASQGQLDPNVLALLMSYRVPEFIQMILPLATLLGILLSYGRMYSENEMTVLIACGFSRFKLLCLSLISSFIISIVIATLTLSVTPWGLGNAEILLESQEDLNEFDVMVPGVFQNISRGARTTYTESINDDEMQNVFMFESAFNRVTVAQSAIPFEDEEGERFILFQKGSLTQGILGDENYSVTEFDELGIRMEKREINVDLVIEEEAMRTSDLINSDDPAHIAELQWRLSLIILIPMLTLIAVPMSRVRPRGGRFGKLAPAIILYILYIGLIVASTDMVASESLSPIVGVWWVHGMFFCIGLLFFFDMLPSMPQFKLKPKK